MTTTLRPTGPLQQEAGGRRSRAYEVCVNSRAVGRVEVATLPSVGPRTGTIHSLRIDEPDRRRGRATVAALAAEEVLRGWNCTQVQVAVAPEEVAAGRLVTVLGYTERSRNMAKPLTAESVPPPEGAGIRPMNEAEFAVWWDEGLESYARSWAERGLPPDEARAKAEADRDAGLPAGLATPGVRLDVLEWRGSPVGLLYLGAREIRPGEPGAWVYDIEVAPDARGRGHGRTLLLHAERAAAEAGQDRIGLHVFAGNTPALRLYESLGYRTTGVNFAKPLL
ncbi:GNAT family N-acetyltransferase [Streptomyces sp. CAU 1734]|uniref:GNAT family N-acetyltransferase n=1 Tax=Streptomyces sp. CAU 1734 TaxID=3140360 RepID=UPI0032617076